MDKNLVRLTYNYKDVAIYKGFLWETAISAKQFAEKLLIPECTAINYRQPDTTARDIEKITELLIRRPRDQNDIEIRFDDFDNEMPRPLGKRPSIAKFGKKLLELGKSIGSSRFASKEVSAVSKQVSMVDNGYELKDIENMQRSGKIVALSFEGRGLNGESFHNLTTAISRVPTLTYLDLQGNKLDDDGAQYLSTVLNNPNCKLVDVTLRDNKISDNGIKSPRGLAAALKASKNLQGIDLSKNMIGLDGVAQLCAGISKHKNLQFLNLSENYFRDEGVHFVAEMLKINKSLEVLLLNSNNLTDTSGQALALCLHRNQSLIRLYLQDNKLSSESAQFFAKVLVLSKHQKLKQFANVTSMRFSKNNLGMSVGQSTKGNSKTLANSYSSLAGHLNQQQKFGLEKGSTSVFRLDVMKEEMGIFRQQNFTLQLLDLQNNHDIQHSDLEMVERALTVKHRYVFEINNNANNKGVESDMVWAEDAWILAETNEGASYIAEAIENLTSSDLMTFKKKVVYEKRKGKTMMETLILAAGHKPKNLSTMPSLDDEINDNEFTVVNVMTLGNSSLENMSASTAGFANMLNLDSNNFSAAESSTKLDPYVGFLLAIKAIYKIGEFKLNKRDSGERKFSDALEHHSVKLIRTWAKQQKAYDGLYVFDEGAPKHNSVSCELRFATDIETDEKVALKIMKNEGMFRNEVHCRRQLKALCLNDADRQNYYKYVLDVLKSVEKPERRYLVMPRLERSLFDVINTEQIAGYDLDAITKIMRNAAEALRFINSKGMIHGDYKPRNFMKTSYAENTWQLIDLDGSVFHGELLGFKHSAAYSPPELVRSLYFKPLEGNNLVAHYSFDVWAFGVVLYELLTGTPLFVSNKLDDNLFTANAKIELINWLEVGKDRLDRVMNNDEINKTMDFEIYGYQIAAAKDLVQKCLQRDHLSRPTFDQILSHPFFSEDPKIRKNQLSDSKSVMKTHFFLSHVQVQAAGTVKDIFYSSQHLGCVSWLDMEAGDLTVEGMHQGVANAEHFIQILTRNTLESPYVVLELLWAIDLGKSVIVIVEVEDRKQFYPFDREYFKKCWDDDAFLETLANNILNISNLNFMKFYDTLFKKYLKQFNNNEHKAFTTLLKNDARKFIESSITEDKLIPYRRRNYETNAMMEQIMSSIGFVTPNKLLSEVDAESSERKREVEKDKMRNTRILVLRGKTDKGEYLNFYKHIREGMKKFFPLMNFEEQYVEIECTNSTEINTLIDNGVEFAEKIQKSAKVKLDAETKKRISKSVSKHGLLSSSGSLDISGRTKEIFLLLLTPGFFSTKHGESLRRCETEYWKNKNDAPVVVIQYKWFAQSEEVRRQELNGYSFESIMLHTEIMSYRDVTPRLYEHEAMLKEAARRIGRLGRRIHKI